jgi:hypothetical protein
MFRASPPPFDFAVLGPRLCVCVRKSGDNYGSADAFSKNPRVVAFRSQKRSRRLRRRELRPGHVAVWRRAERRFNNAAGPGKLGAISAAPSITSLRRPRACPASPRMTVLAASNCSSVDSLIAPVFELHLFWHQALRRLSNTQPTAAPAPSQGLATFA